MDAFVAGNNIDDRYGYQIKLGLNMVLRLPVLRDGQVTVYPACVYVKRTGDHIKTNYV